MQSSGNLARGVPERRSPVWVLALLGLGAVGAVKGTPLLSDAPIDLTAACAAAVAVGVALRASPARLLSSYAVPAVIGLWAVFAVGVVTAADGNSGSKAAILYTVTLLCALGAVCLVADDRARTWLLGGTVGVAALAVVAALAMPDMGAAAIYGRLNLDGVNTVGFGRLVGAGAVVLAVYALAGNRRAVFGAAAALSGVALLATGGRGPVLGYIVAGCVTVGATRLFRRRKAWTFAAVGLVVAAAGSTSGLLDTRPVERVLSLTDGGAVDESRMMLLGEAWQIAWRHPFGVGWDGFASYLPAGAMFVPHRYPHNITAELAVEGGWLAVVAFTALVCVAIRACWRASSTPAGAAMLALVVYWLMQAHLSSDINGNRMTWIILFATLGLGGLEKRAEEVDAVSPTSGPAPAMALNAARSAA